MSKKETQRNAEIVWVYETQPELSYADLGELYDISRQRVGKILKDAGVLDKKEEVNE